ncbi:TPA: hypothetical protein ACV1MF_001229 [Campylobacter jejuni]
MKDFTYDELVDCVENFDPRIELLKEGFEAIYVNRRISNKAIMQCPNGKCYFIKSNDELKRNEIVRELTQEEYAKLDLVKGRDF